MKEAHHHHKKRTVKQKKNNLETYCREILSPKQVLQSDGEKETLGTQKYFFLKSIIIEKWEVILHEKHRTAEQHTK